MFSTNEKYNSVLVEGDPVAVSSELCGVMVGVYRIARENVGEKIALALMVKVVQKAIQHEKIRTTDILEAIRDVEKVDDVLHG